jgi:hypothetical protein
MAMPMVFLVVSTLPKLHTNDLSGWTSTLSKIALVLVSMVKSFFFEVETVV